MFGRRRAGTPQASGGASRSVTDVPGQAGHRGESAKRAARGRRRRASWGRYASGKVVRAPARAVPSHSRLLPAVVRGRFPIVIFAECLALSIHFVTANITCSGRSLRSLVKSGPGAPFRAEGKWRLPRWWPGGRPQSRPPAGQTRPDRTVIRRSACPRHGGRSNSAGPCGAPRRPETP